jgi:hypothetical protein
VTTGKGRWGQLVGYRAWTEGERTSHEEGGEDEDVQSRRDGEGLRIGEGERWRSNLAGRMLSSAATICTDLLRSIRQRGKKKSSLVAVKSHFIFFSGLWLWGMLQPNRNRQSGI